MERQVLSEPFEVLAFDLVGPFPKAKNGYRFVLTAICMGSKWPEAIPSSHKLPKQLLMECWRFSLGLGYPYSF